MKKLIKPACLLFYFLTLLVFFFTGVVYVIITGAAKNQGLAGGAIVLWYGCLTALLAFIAALVMCFYMSHKNIVIANRILAAMFVLFIAIFTYRYFIKV